MHISSTRGAPEGHHIPSILWHSDDAVARRREPSLGHSCYVGNHNACSIQGAKRPMQDLVGRDLLHYSDSDPDNHGRQPRIQDAQCSSSLDACVL
jgi:hypothetical protein